MWEQFFTMIIDPFDNGWTIVDLQDIDPISTSEEEDLDYVRENMAQSLGLNKLSCKSCKSGFYTHNGMKEGFCSKQCEDEFPFLKNNWIPIEIVVAVCECGSEKCGLPKHSDYCPKYKE